jgi:H+/Cl- antiporter ClcA
MTRMKIVVWVAVAVALGVIVMLAPLMVFTVYSYHSVVTEVESGQESPSGIGGNQTYSTTEGGIGNKSVPSPTLSEAARVYGMLDAKTETFPSSLFPVVLLVAIGLMMALGVSLFYRRRK